MATALRGRPVTAYSLANELVADVYAEAHYWTEGEVRREVALCSEVCEQIDLDFDALLEDLPDLTPEQVKRINQTRAWQRAYWIEFFRRSIHDTQTRGERYREMARQINQRFTAAARMG